MADQLPAIELMTQYRKSDHILQQLREGGFTTCNQLVMCTRKEVSERTGLSRARVHNLRKTARKIILAETGVDPLADAADEEEIQGRLLLIKHCHILKQMKRKTRKIKALSARLEMEVGDLRLLTEQEIERQKKFKLKLILCSRKSLKRLRRAHSITVYSIKHIEHALKIIGAPKAHILRLHPSVSCRATRAYLEKKVEDADEEMAVAEDAIVEGINEAPAGMEPGAADEEMAVAEDAIVERINEYGVKGLLPTYLYLAKLIKHKTKIIQSLSEDIKGTRDSVRVDDLTSRITKQEKERVTLYRRKKKTVKKIKRADLLVVKCRKHIAVGIEMIGQRNVKKLVLHPTAATAGAHAYLDQLLRAAEARG